METIALSLPDSLLALVEVLRAAGGRPFLVGGAVRDTLLGLPVKDFDIEVYGLAADQLRRVLASRGRVEEVGESFAVYKVAGLDGVTGEVDVSLPRHDSKSGAGHRGFTVVGDPDMPVEEAVRRRDFTINAILADPSTGEIVDPANGRADLAARRLRVVDPERFGEDSLRVLRAAQFAARFDLEVEASTSILCRSIDLADLPAERVSSEMEKLLLRAPRPSIGLALLKEWGKIEQVAPELLPLVDCPQDPVWHPEGDVWVHTLMATDRIATVVSGTSWGNLLFARAWTVALAILCHDLGKPPTTEFRDGRWRSHNHEEAGIEPTLSLLDRWNVFSRDGYDVRRQVVGLVANHLKPGQFHDEREKVRDAAFRRLARKCELDLLARVAAADSLGRNGDFTDEPMRWFAAKARELEVAIEPPRPLLMGRHLAALGVAAGPEMGRLLATVYDMQLEGEVSTLDGAIDAARVLLAAPPRLDAEGGDPRA